MLQPSQGNGRGTISTEVHKRWAARQSDRRRLHSRVPLLPVTGSHFSPENSQVPHYMSPRDNGASRLAGSGATRCLTPGFSVIL